MAKAYTLFVDESGDSGISNIRSEEIGGSSQFMVLGGVLIADDLKESLSSSLNQICSDLEIKRLHCKNIQHPKKVYYSRTVSGLDLTCFGVISYKYTLGQYPQINESFRYYHKCVQYLLQQLCKYIQQEDIDPNSVSVVFEETGALRLPQLRNFIFRCVYSPLYPQSKILEMLDTSNFDAQKKKDEPLLQLADLVANSLYQCVNKSQKNYDIPETRYINELRTKFWGNPEDGKVIGYGIKAIYALHNLNLDADVLDFFKELKNT